MKTYPEIHEFIQKTNEIFRYYRAWDAVQISYIITANQSINEKEKKTEYNELGVLFLTQLSNANALLRNISNNSEEKDMVNTASNAKIGSNLLEQQLGRLEALIQEENSTTEHQKKIKKLLCEIFKKEDNSPFWSFIDSMKKLSDKNTFTKLNSIVSDIKKNSSKKFTEGLHKDSILTKAAEGKSRDPFTNLFDFFVYPMQRILKYPLLLKGIMKKTPSTELSRYHNTLETELKEFNDVAGSFSDIDSAIEKLNKSENKKDLATKTQGLQIQLLTLKQMMRSNNSNKLNENSADPNQSPNIDSHFFLSVGKLNTNNIINSFLKENELKSSCEKLVNILDIAATIRDFDYSWEENIKDKLILISFFYEKNINSETLKEFMSSTIQKIKKKCSSEMGRINGYVEFLKSAISDQQIAIHNKHVKMNYVEEIEKINKNPCLSQKDDVLTSNDTFDQQLAGLDDLVVTISNLKKEIKASEETSGNATSFKGWINAYQAQLQEINTRYQNILKNKEINSKNKNIQLNVLNTLFPKIPSSESSYSEYLDPEIIKKIQSIEAETRDLKIKIAVAGFDKEVERIYAEISEVVDKNRDWLATPRSIEELAEYKNSKLYADLIEQIQSLLSQAVQKEKEFQVTPNANTSHLFVEQVDLLKDCKSLCYTLEKHNDALTNELIEDCEKNKKQMTKQINDELFQNSLKKAKKFIDQLTADPNFKKMAMRINKLQGSTNSKKQEKYSEFKKLEGELDDIKNTEKCKDTTDLLNALSALKKAIGIDSDRYKKITANTGWNIRKPPSKVMYEKFVSQATKSIDDIVKDINKEQEQAKKNIETDSNSKASYYFIPSKKK